MNHYHELAEILRHRLAVIGDQQMRTEQPEQQLELLQQAGEKIEQWKGQHLKSCPKQLQHFLVQYSLEKALKMLELEILESK